MRRLRHRARAARSGTAWTVLLVGGIAGAWALSAVAFGNGLQPAGASPPAARAIAPLRAGCTAPGAGGRRVRAVYVVGDRQVDRFANLQASFRRITQDID